ncbi:MAG TPA: hypothetical protein VGF92_23535 [Stellaceae bacterium]
MVLEFVRRRAQTGRDHGILEENRQTALARGFLPQILGRATFRKHSALTTEIQTQGNDFGSRYTDDNVPV